MNLIQSVVEHMRTQSIDQWDEIYPNSNKILDDITQQSGYIAIDADQIVGYVVLNTVQAPEYQDCTWTLDDKQPLVIHRLCVHAQHQGKGYAVKLVHWAEQFAIEKKYRSIRLDAFVQNPAALRLYQKLGYQKTGKVNFRKGIFYCYEKVL
jgi:ribosomal protein S18 acetylase RimI-like enzyme